MCLGDVEYGNELPLVRQLRYGISVEKSFDAYLALRSDPDSSDFGADDCAVSRIVPTGVILFYLAQKIEKIYYVLLRLYRGWRKRIDAF